jgi:hypothetical protein
MISRVPSVTLNYLEIIFTFSDHPQYIARFGNFNIGMFNDVIDFNAFIFQVLTNYETSELQLTNNLCKISCYQKTNDEEFYHENNDNRFEFATREVISNSNMPEWYDTGKWLYNDYAALYLSDRGLMERYPHSIMLLESTRLIVDFCGWYQYHDFYNLNQTDYALDNDNLIYFGKFEDCPTHDFSNIQFIQGF